MLRTIQHINRVLVQIRYSENQNKNPTTIGFLFLIEVQRNHLLRLTNILLLPTLLAVVGNKLIKLLSIINMIRLPKTNMRFFIFMLTAAGIIAAVALYANNPTLNQSREANQPALQETDGQTNDAPSGEMSREEKKFIILETEELVYGTGREAKNGDTLLVHYIGTLPDGTKFDSSYDRNEPFSFTLGAGEVIKGWDRGFEEMKESGKRRLIIPPEFGYGDSVAAGGKIPANSTLIFEIELLKVK